MRMSQTIGTLLLMSAFVVSSGQQAAAAAGDSVSVGGQILEPGDDWKISFGGWATELNGSVFEGQLQINFHRVGDATLNKANFHGNVVTDISFFNGDTESCNAAMNMTINGTLDGDPGYSVIFRAGDAGSPGNTTAAEPFDTARIQLFEQPDAAGGDIYDTNGGDFTGQSNCVGSARTGLDRGNITIELP